MIYNNNRKFWNQILIFLTLASEDLSTETSETACNVKLIHSDPTLRGYRSHHLVVTHNTSTCIPYPSTCLMHSNENKTKRLNPAVIDSQRGWNGKRNSFWFRIEWNGVFGWKRIKGFEWIHMVRFSDLI